MGLVTGLLIIGIRLWVQMERNSFSFEVEPKSVLLTVKTLSPTKWLLIDRETGQIYQGNPEGHWDRLDPKIKINKETK